MGNISLTPRAALQGASLQYEGLHIEELPQLKLLSVAAQEAKIADVSNALNSRCGLTWPEVGQSTSSAQTTCLGLQDSQVFLLNEMSDLDHATLAADLSQNASITDQSDSWVSIKLSGERSRDVLERICPIDLHPDIFTDGNVARSVMEHLGVIVFRQGDAFLLLSARSSAESFLHVLTQSVDFVL